MAVPSPFGVPPQRRRRAVYEIAPTVRTAGAAPCMPFHAARPYASRAVSRHHASDAGLGRVAYPKFQSGALAASVGNLSTHMPREPPEMR